MHSCLVFRRRHAFRISMMLPLTIFSVVVVAVLAAALYFVLLALISCADVSTVLLVLLNFVPSVMDEARLFASWLTTVVFVPSVTEEAI